MKPRWVAAIGAALVALTLVRLFRGTTLVFLDPAMADPPEGADRPRVPPNTTSSSKDAVRFDNRAANEVDPATVEASLHSIKTPAAASTDANTDLSPTTIHTTTTISMPTNNTTTMSIQIPEFTRINAHQNSTSDNTSDQRSFRPGDEFGSQECLLEPGWGIAGHPNLTTNPNNHRKCVGKTPPWPNTTAHYLSCPSDKGVFPANPRLQPGITIALLYFAKPALLFRQLQEFATYPPEAQDQLTLLIIDDASPPGLRASDYLDLDTNPYRFAIRLVRITTSTDWNIGGARNLAFHLIDTPRALLLDLDILVPSDAFVQSLGWTLRKLHTTKTGTTTTKLAHRFNRQRGDGSRNKHPAVCVIATNDYWENGGCDEDFVGNYGFTDVHFWHRWKADPTKELVDHKEAMLYELDGVAPCGADLLPRGDHARCKQARANARKPNRNLKANHGLFKSKTKKGCWSPNYLRFGWIVERW